MFSLIPPNPVGEHFGGGSEFRRGSQFYFLFHLQLVELELERHVLRAVGAVVIRETAAGDLHVLAHIDAPGVVRVAAEESV